MRPHSLELRNAQEELLNHPTNAEHSDDDTASDASAEQIFPNDGHPSETLYNGHRIAPFLMRALALLCAMSLSIGSHLYVEITTVYYPTNPLPVAPISLVLSSHACLVKLEPLMPNSH